MLKAGDIVRWKKTDMLLVVCKIGGNRPDGSIPTKGNWVWVIPLDPTFKYPSSRKCFNGYNKNSLTIISSA